MQNFQKNEHFLPTVGVCIRRQEKLVFRKVWRTFLSCYLRFEIHPFALLTTTSEGLPLRVLM